MNQKRIKPQTLKGFRDYLPSVMLARESLMDVARDVFRSFGYAPIDTPALEYSEILLGKGGEESDKQLFRFNDQGNRDVAMRFDLTVPFARFASQYAQQLGTPFKRYHIGTVWRAEKPQKGRYREFVQCDFDTIGTDANSADIETLFAIHDLIEKIGFSDFTIRVNNRLILNGLLESLDLQDKTALVLRSLDKLFKIGRERVVEELVRSVGTSEGQATAILDLVSVKGSSMEILEKLDARLSGSEQGQLGVQRLRELFECCKAAGIPHERVALDVSIARGLDYYTGTVYETFLNDLPSIGSVCSGGRYDDLTGLFTAQPLPGVGASLGLDRLLAAMEELGMVTAGESPASVLVTVLDQNRIADYLRIGRTLRTSGFAVEVYTDSRAIKKQLAYANRKKFRVAIIAGDEEFGAGNWQVKDLLGGEQTAVAESDLPKVLGEMLAAEV